MNEDTKKMTLGDLLALFQKIEDVSWEVQKDVIGVGRTVSPEQAERLFRMKAILEERELHDRDLALREASDATYRAEVADVSAHRKFVAEIETARSAAIEKNVLVNERIASTNERIAVALEAIAASLKKA
jgi:hypothetical protein